MKLNELKPAYGAVKKRKRLGRGDSSGHGGTSCKGHKGQKSRSGGYHKAGFEGGQMPLQRRLPKYGFTNIFRKEFAIVNLDQLDEFSANSEVTYEVLLDKGLVSKSKDGIKVLGRGELKIPLKFKINKCSESARKKIEAVGGTVEVI